MDYMNYTLWQPAGATPKPAINTGCGTLSYNITKNSWEDVWLGNNILSRPAGAAYFSQTGTKHIIWAKFREQIGNHYVLLEVKSDLQIISANRTLNFTLEIKDCYVNEFTPGFQAMRTVEVSKDELVIFPFNEFKMQPLCGFQVNYTVTLV